MAGWLLGGGITEQQIGAEALPGFTVQSDSLRRSEEFRPENDPQFLMLEPQFYLLCFCFD